MTLLLLLLAQAQYSSQSTPTRTFSPLLFPLSALSFFALSFASPITWFFSLSDSPLLPLLPTLHPPPYLFILLPLPFPSREDRQLAHAH